MSAGPTTRYGFANQLRGVAALCVVANHLAGVYWSEPALVGRAIGAPVPTVAPPAFTALAAGSWYNLGPFGVALFFLISGFVIPLSLDRQSVPGFALARILRIYPTYVIALGLELAVVAWSAHAWQQPFPYHAREIVANALLATDIARVPSLDLVNWTLMVELKFYLAMALVAPLIRRGSLPMLAAIVALILGVSRFSHQIFSLIPALGLPLLVFEMNALYVLFMLIGVVFSYHVRGLISTLRAALAVTGCFLTFVVCWPLTFFRGDFPLVTYNYGYALVIFAVCYAARDRIPDARIARFFAAISYPLYLVHALIGYCVIALLIARGWSAAPATLAALAVVIALACALHAGIEQPSQRLGKVLAARWFPRGKAVAKRDPAVADSPH